eukprot:7394265-Alexandrium_andersonii.AAC.1
MESTKAEDSESVLATTTMRVGGKHVSESAIMNTGFAFWNSPRPRSVLCRTPILSSATSALWQPSAAAAFPGASLNQLGSEPTLRSCAQQ